MKFGLTPAEIRSIQEIFREFHEVEEVLVFGSRAIGNSKEASDLDLVIKGKDVDFSLIGKIKGRLEETTPLPYFFDLVDFKSISNLELKKHIQQYGQVIYSK